VAAPGEGPSTSRSSNPGERMRGGALGLPNEARGASIRRGGELALEREWRWGKNSPWDIRRCLFMGLGFLSLAEDKLYLVEEFEFQLGSRINLDLEIILGLLMVEHGICSPLSRPLP
jgi:hypothetical protein